MNVERVGLGDNYVGYRDAWALQRQVHADVVAGSRPDTLLLLEHANVYTAGRRTSRAERPAGCDVVDVDRGGRITWHGPGQLVVYPIVRLREPVDVVGYVRALERAVIALAAQWQVTAVQVAGRSGAWVPGNHGAPDRKLAAIGVRVAQRVTMHGIAINACPDLTAFDPIVPCGIVDAAVTSLSVETEATITPLDIAEATTGHLRTALAPLVGTAAIPPADAAAPADHATSHVPA